MGYPITRGVMSKVCLNFLRQTGASLGGIKVEGCSFGEQVLRASMSAVVGNGLSHGMWLLISHALDPAFASWL